MLHTFFFFILLTYSPHSFFRTLFINETHFSKKSLLLGSLNSKPMTVYLMLNNTLMGTNNAYLNVRMKEASETLLLKFSKQTKHDNDSRIR